MGAAVGVYREHREFEIGYSEGFESQATLEEANVTLRELELASARGTLEPFARGLRQGLRDRVLFLKFPILATRCDECGCPSRLVDGQLCGGCRDKEDDAELEHRQVIYEKEMC